MRQVIALALQDVRLVLTERGSAIARLIMPVIFIFVVGIANDAFQSDEPPPPIMELVDADGSRLSSFYLGLVVSGATGIDVCGDGAEPCPNGGGEKGRRERRVANPSEMAESAAALGDGSARQSGAGGDPAAALPTEVVERLESGRVSLVLMVPEGFGPTLLAGDDSQATVRLIFSRGDPQLASRVRPLIESAAGRVALVARAGEAARELAEGDVRVEGLARARAVETLDAQRVVTTRTAIELPERHELVGFQQSVPGMGSMFVMLSVLAGAGILVSERSRWTLQRTLIAPVSRAGFIAGKIAGRFLVGMVQYAVAIATALVLGSIFGIAFGSSPGLMILVMSAFVLAASGISVLLATLVEREQQASGLTTLLAVTLAPLGGAWWSLDIEIIPDVMRRVAVVSPFYWVMEGFRAAIHNLGPVEAALPVGVLLAIAVAAGGLASLRLGRE